MADQMPGLAARFVLTMTDRDILRTEVLLVNSMQFAQGKKKIKKNTSLKLYF